MALMWLNLMLLWPLCVNGRVILTDYNNCG
ncbi:hypothetical protein SEVIR_2G271399v4 [Setaria viridis]